MRTEEDDTRPTRPLESRLARPELQAPIARHPASRVRPQIDTSPTQLYIDPMLRTILALTLLLSLAFCVGCGSQPKWEPAQAKDLFKPVAMRIHPVFTQIRSWSGGATPNGIEVLIEFHDQFGDPAKASGNVVFELYDYRPGFPDPRGPRVVNPFLASLDNIASQREHWNRTSRCYSFQLAYPQINPARTYVLTCTFEQTGGGRFLDRIVLEPPRPAKSPEEPATRPTETPGVRSQQP